MPRAYDRYPTARGMGRDSLYSPTRGGLPWQNPLEAITGTATDTIGAIGGFLRTALALEQLEQAFAEFAGEFTGVADGGPLDWDIPETIRVAIAAAAKLGVDIGAWLVQVFKNITRIDLTEHSQFLKDLLALLAFADLQEAWDTFLSGWTALDWGSPLTAMHPGWKLVVDFAWDVADWSAQVLANITGISWPGFLGLDALRGHWAAFSTAWEAVNWANPLTGIHGAWMALVDLAWNLWDWALTVLRNLTGIEIPNFLDIDTLKGLWQQFTDAWAAITWSSLTAIWSAISAVGNLLRQGTHWLIGVIRNLTGIDLEPIAESFGITALVDAVTTWADTLAGINWLSAGALMAAIGAFIALFQALGNWLLGVINAWLGWSTGAVGDMFSSVGNFIGKIIEFFWGETGLAGWVNTLEKLGGFVGATIVDAITAAYQEFSRLASMIGNFLSLGGLVDFIGSVLGERGLLGWLASLPIIGPLVSALTGIPPNTGIELDWSTLTTWAQGLLTGDSSIPGGNIVGQISSALLSIIPVAHISDSSPNLLSQGNFNNAITVSDGGGWSWDGTTTATGTGGSAKAVATGALQELFSRQAVKVNAGDRVDISCQVKTSGFTAASGRSMVLSVIPWKVIGGVMTQQDTVVIATRTASASTFQAMTGSAYVVPSGVVRIQLRLAVTANSGAAIWFDDGKISKGGYLGQNLVDSLINAWNDLFGGLTNPLAGAGGTTGKTWNDLFSGASAFRSSYNTEADRGNTLRLNLFGSPTTVGSQIGTNAVPNITREKSTDMQSIINNLWRGLRGQSSDDYTADDVYSAAYYTQDSVAKVKAQVTDLNNKAASGAFSGKAIAVDFSALSPSSVMPSPWQNTVSNLSSPNGSGALGIAAGRATWVTDTLDNRRSFAIHGTATDTNYQNVTAVFASMPAGNEAANYIVARSNSTGSYAVVAKFTLLAVELFVVTNNSWTSIGQKTSNYYTIPGTYRVECGVGAVVNRVRVWQDGNILIDQTSASAATGYKQSGIGADARTYTRGGQTRQAVPADFAAFALADNTPVGVLGSGMRVVRTDTATTTVAAATTATALPTSFYATTPDESTADLTYTSGNRVTATVAGWYLVTVAVKRATWTDTRQVFAAAIRRNGTEYAVAHQQWGVSVLSATADFSGQRGSSVISVPVYLAAGHYVEAAYVAAASTLITGSAGGAESFFSVVFLNNTKPVQAAA